MTCQLHPRSPRLAPRRLPEVSREVAAHAAE